MSKKHVLVMTPCEASIQKKLKEKCGEFYDFTFLNGSVPDPSDYESAQIIIGEPDYERIKDLRQLEWVQMTWAGTDKYTRNGPFPEGVRLTNASGAFGVIISEYIIAGILSLYRRLAYYKERQKEHRWSPLAHEMILYGKKALLLGTGNITSETARRLKAFGCETIGLHRSTEAVESFDRTDHIQNLETYLPQVDLLISALPNNDESMNLMTYERFAMMKKEAVFVNVGRGNLIVEGALERALEEGMLAGAVLDVQRKEPLAEDSPLWDYNRVIITPHIAGPSFSATLDTQRRIYDICIRNLLEYASSDK